MSTRSLKLLFTLCLAIFTMSFAAAQDIIILKDGKRIEAKIIEVSDYEIRYNEWDDPNGIVFTVDRAMIKEIRYSFGRRETQEDPEENTLYYFEDRINNLKINFTALGGATTVLLYERGLSPHSGIEGYIKLNGVGFNNDNEKSGFGLGAGYKVKIGSLFKKDSYRPKHYLAGWYFKPGIGFNAVNADRGQYESYNYVHFGFDIGHQWVFRNSISLDMFMGFHYYGGSFDERGSGDIFFEDDFADGNIAGADNVAWMYGIRVGFVFGSEDDKKKKRRR
jgi:hypothetical protein